MFVRSLRRKTTKNVSVQIVYGYRNAEGKPRLKIVRHMGSAPDRVALEALLRVAKLEMRRLQEQGPPSSPPPIAQRSPPGPQAQAANKTAAHLGCP